MNIPTGHTWTDDNFSNLGWNASRLYGWILPGRQHQFMLFIDYCLKTPITYPEFGKYELVPVELMFENVVGLKINLNMENYSELNIVHIERTNNRPSPNGKFTYWDYLISLTLDGMISFASTGFTQTTLSDSVVTEDFDLERETKISRVNEGKRDRKCV